MIAINNNFFKATIENSCLLAAIINYLRLDLHDDAYKIDEEMLIDRYINSPLTSKTGGTPALFTPKQIEYVTKEMYKAKMTLTIPIEESDIEEAVNNTRQPEHPLIKEAILKCEREKSAFPRLIYLKEKIKIFYNNLPGFIALQIPDDSVYAHLLVIKKPDPTKGEEMKLINSDGIMYNLEEKETLKNCIGIVTLIPQKPIDEICKKVA
jgi:hypothetical protein